MNSLRTYLFFAQEHEDLAKTLQSDLQAASLQVFCNSPASVFEPAVKQEPDSPIILLLSDMLLESIEYMPMLLEVLQNRSCSHVFPILMPSVRRNEDGEVELYDTDIETVQGQFRCRDFWYDEWIRLRRQASNQNEEGKEILGSLKTKIEQAKRMYSETPSFLRKLISYGLLSYEGFQADSYQQFFEKLGQGESSQHERFPLKKETEEEEEKLITEELEQEPEASIPEDTKEEEAEQKDYPLEEEEEVEQELNAFTLSLDNLPSDIDTQELYEQFDIEEISDIDVLFYIAEAETEEGSFNNARHCYERILQLDPANGRALLWIARLFARHFPEEAIQADMYYKRALLFNEESAQLYYEYALLIQKHFQAYRRAVDLLHQAIDLAPDYAEAYLLLARCELALGLLQSSKSQYLQALLLNPELRQEKLEQQLAILRPQSPEQEPEEAYSESSPQVLKKNPNANTTVLVTGASSGIGKAIAERFAVEGYKVIISARREERLKIIKKGLEDRFDVHIHTMPMDVQAASSVEEALKSLPAEYANIDILVNNAGLAKGLAPIHEGKWEDWDTMIDTNIKGVLRVTRAVSPGMVARGKGHIINIGSTAASDAYPMGNVYCATKAALQMLGRTMRLDLYKHGVKVSAVHPGHVETEFALVRFEQDSEKANIYQDFMPLQARDVADAVYYTASLPEHVMLQDMLLTAAQQCTTRDIDRSGRK